MIKTMKALLLLLPFSTATSATDADFLRCRSITDPVVRLACYDAVAIPAAVTGSTAIKPPAQGELRTSPPVTAPPAPAQAVAPSRQKADQFGLENRTSPAMVDAIESHIPGRFEGWEAKSTIKLANGQVWQIADDSNRYLTLNDPKVRIHRGALGAFYLEFEKVNHSPRVRRVQ